LNTLNVHFLPELVTAGDLAGSTCIVIDVLRASTTIVTALAAGARAVVPCLTVEDARSRAASLPRGEAVLAGERGGVPIAGFDLGNSPSEFTPSAVAGKTVVFTTTNGTKTLVHCRQARRIVVGAFVNFSAACRAVSDASPLNVVCAGTDGHITREDVLAAGAIAARLMEQGSWALNDEACIALDFWHGAVTHLAGAQLKSRLAGAIRGSRGGANLMAIGMGADIELAAEIDQFSIVPRFDPTSGEIRSEEP
jgi:2-phosphosulfolactate phosphatase